MWTLISDWVSFVAGVSKGDKYPRSILKKEGDSRCKNVECLGGRTLEQKENFQVLIRDEKAKCGSLCGVFFSFFSFFLC